MVKRPDINSRLNGDTFRSFYYLKEELMSFCKTNGLPTSGGKIEITDRASNASSNTLTSSPITFATGKLPAKALKLP